MQYIKCKDCPLKDYHFLLRAYAPPCVRDDGFCSYGERKDDVLDSK